MHKGKNLKYNYMEKTVPMSEIVGAWMDQLAIADRFIEGYWTRDSVHFNESLACAY